MHKSKETFTELQEREAYLNTPELQHHISMMENPDNYNIDVRVKLYNQLVAEKKQLEEQQPETWKSFVHTTDYELADELLNQYQTGVGRLQQLEFLINQAYNRL